DVGSNKAQPDSLLPALEGLARGIRAFFVRLKRQWRLAQRDHRRAARLCAYRRRQQWGIADVPRLVGLEVSRPPQKRMTRLLANGKRGRGVVRPYQSLEVVIGQWVKLFLEIDNPETSPARRLALLKLTPWWPQLVDGLCRSEHELARQIGKKSPAEF